MIIVIRSAAYVLAALVLLLAASMALTGNWVRAIALFLAALAMSPAFGWFLEVNGSGSRAVVHRGVAVVALLGAFLWISATEERDSIYASPDIRDQFHAMYHKELASWPVPFESTSLETEYGQVHVLVSGPEDGPPMLLLHASGVASWSWRYNVEDLSGPFRTYAIDLIGDAGLSEYSTLKHTMRNGEDQADLYAAVMDHFGIDSAIVVGASDGGFIATNLATHHPERVERMVLLGPMGYAGAGLAISRITLTQMFPFRALQDATFRWAFSDDERLREVYSEWFPLLMEGVFPRKVAPFTFSAGERQRVSVPTLFVFGDRDNLVGDVDRARALVQDVPEVATEIIDAGHLMGGEVPRLVNPLILKFAARSPLG